MTSTTDRAEHPDVAEISELTEGLLPQTRTADVRRHLDTCDLCADVHASLEEIRGMLGTLPGPPRMPEDIAGRIDAALAAEALLDATAPEPAEQNESGPSTDLPDEPGTRSTTDDRHDVSRETSATDRPSGHARTASTGPGRKNRTRRVRRRAAVLGTVLGAAALGLGTVLVSSLMGGGESGTTAAGRPSTAQDTFSRATLPQQVTDLLAQNTKSISRTPHSFGIQSDSGGTGTGDPRVYKQPTVPDCVQRGIGRDDAALATEEGVYQGSDALLVVLPDAKDSTRVTAYIVDARCVQEPSSSDAAEVLLQSSYARP
ncbi:MULTISPECIES: hypothetical protein [unclassified Streptomyces]|uniref:hypothetical protein n=1 Tax=unclassified Streptomyces TaxID=2593676 RepID=UPI001F045DAA|nr:MULTISPECIES: hypothetical protein [unclassified Streptomyces]MCH0564403.1 hypothetical protein [Streptomyces sp. MUM 2J]MCH0569384.1 hypothetical protein [Streptomyces sp. MUM 136J]